MRAHAFAFLERERERQTDRDRASEEIKQPHKVLTRIDASPVHALHVQPTPVTALPTSDRPRALVSFTYHLNSDRQE